MIIRTQGRQHSNMLLVECESVNLYGSELGDFLRKLNIDLVYNLKFHFWKSTQKK